VPTLARRRVALGSGGSTTVHEILRTQAVIFFIDLEV
jgi:hypothetical protein